MSGLIVNSDEGNRTHNLHQRTSMSIYHIITFLELCIKITYFLFQVMHYDQIHGTAMGSPISPFLANLFMKEFETKAINTASNPKGNGSGMWMTHLLSKRQNTDTSSYSTSTLLTLTSNSLQRPLCQIDPYPFGHLSFIWT